MSTPTSVVDWRAAWAIPSIAVSCLRTACLAGVARARTDVQSTTLPSRTAAATPFRDLPRSNTSHLFRQPNQRADCGSSCRVRPRHVRCRRQLLVAVREFDPSHDEATFQFGKRGSCSGVAACRLRLSRRRHRRGWAVGQTFADGLAKASLQNQGPFQVRKRPPGTAGRQWVRFQDGVCGAPRQTAAEPRQVTRGQLSECVPVTPIWPPSIARRT